MKNIKRILLLLAILCMMTVCACNNSNTKEPVPEEDTQETVSDDLSYVIVRSAECGKNVVQLCTKLKDYLISNGANASIEKSNDGIEHEDTNTRYILIGETSFPLSKTNQARVSGEKASFLMEGNQISICAANEQVLWLATEQWALDCSANGNFVMHEIYQEIQKDYSSQLRSGWTFSFPAYSAGKLNEQVYSAGYGLKQSGDNNRSYMQLIDSTTAQDFEEWKNSVVAYGYREVFANSIEDNLYVSYKGALGTLYYAEFRSDLGQVKVISDAASTALDEFCYTLESNDHPEFYMLETAGGEDDLFLIHASDDSWIVIDGGLGDGYGGVMEQRGHDIFAFMEKRSQMINGKLVISAWYCSHAHRDHFTGFLSVLKLHSKQIDLQRVILNTPDPQIDVITNTPHLENNKQLSEFMPLVELISAQYPDVKVLKAHTGMEIQIADISFTILHTQEDLLEKWYANEASWNLTDYNSSSLVSMIEMDDIKILMMGDNFRPDLTINHYSMKTTLACNLFKVGHHYINVHADDWYRALYNTCKFQYAIVTHNGLRQTGDYLKSQLKENFILQSFDITYSFSFDGEKIVCNQYRD